MMTKYIVTDTDPDTLETPNNALTDFDHLNCCASFVTLREARACLKKRAALTNSITYLFKLELVETA